MAQGVLKELIDRYEKLRKEKDDLKEKTKKNEEDFKNAQIDLARAITELEQDSAQDGDYVYTPKTAPKYSFKSQEDLDAAGLNKFDVLRENGLGEIVVDFVGWQTLNSALRELNESGEGIPDEVLEVVNAYDDISISRTKKKSDKRDKLKAAFERRDNNV